MACDFCINPGTGKYEYNCLCTNTDSSSSADGDINIGILAAILTGTASLLWQFVNLMFIFDSYCSQSNNSYQLGKFIGWLIGSGLGCLSYFPIKAAFGNEVNEEARAGYTVASTLAAAIFAQPLELLLAENHKKYSPPTV